MVISGSRPVIWTVRYAFQKPRTSVKKIRALVRLRWAHLDQLAEGYTILFQHNHKLLNERCISRIDISHKLF